MDESDLENQEDKITSYSCLFCSWNDKKVHLLMLHMMRFHSFFIPNVNYLTDGKSLICFLSRCIENEKICIYCGVQSKEYNNAQDVKRHMRAKGHCRINPKVLPNYIYL
ncbi:hypothetical protein MXB_1079 [Myxobolus squamalis]|nr:hypothetical protein MXB_1079 [Myxobolus squamalis]